MKKFFLLALAAAMTISASAEGYQVNTLSAKQLGMGHTSVSQKLNSESLWFNPAAASHQEQKFTAAAGVTGIMATATCTTANDYNNPTTKYKSDNDWSTPMYLYANYKITDDLAFGLSFNTPFGSSMNWGNDWGGASLVQNISLTAYNAQPTISYKMLDGKLSIGAGLMMVWGEYEQSKNLYPKGADVTMSGDAGMKFGYNVGVLYDINDQWSVGASYRSKVTMEVDKGEADITYAPGYESILTSHPDFMPVIGLMSKGFTAELPLPATLSFGATYYPTDRWSLSAEVQWVQWNKYKSLDITFKSADVTVVSEKNYSNTIMFRVGGQYEIADWVTGRIGFYVDESPVASDYLNPETPSMTKVGYTTGFSLMPCKNNRNFSLDFSYAYISSADPERAGSCPLAQDPATGNWSAFRANYTTKAHCVAFGATWGF